MKKAIGVYRFLDKNGNVLYVGKATGSSGLIGRLERHNNYKKNNPKHYSLCYAKTREIEVAICDSVEEAENLEKYCIDLYRPEYNTKYYKKFSAVNKEIVWVNYSALRGEKEKQIVKQLWSIAKEYNQKYKRSIGSDTTDYICYEEGILGGNPLKCTDQVRYCMRYRSLRKEYENISLKFHNYIYKEWTEYLERI